MPGTCVTDLFAGRATLARSVRLLNQFRFEQSDPARFYGALADDTAAMVGDLWGGRPPGTLLDVGGGPGYFATAFGSVVPAAPTPSTSAPDWRWSPRESA